ncbi:CCR4-NOT transcription complex subunit 2-like [Varroa jacobsoni]|uniref:NOT2/NOT3/NOT5 C-terminal domain-containing protein n=1 Tax=Varroa destructor TaxID=109461 RepID=A0A7M7JKK9_VARDE|nr:CCR4-NOT transcription complex subunit 2-like isoform X1 [Varroa destructor]XP_022653627.1 CCR4-NOT transcription complex subunit 2-like isoform X1 [Varroa destructor]XP_022653628.1 CCR4-NOT transcription complex subunit 2-like isoform X1 [Varroa destructor]XP_022686458.1 CCR4-NOT transcription complex subunit 2-like [Varroa jacobsoni]
MSSPSPSQLAYGQPTGSSLIPFFVGSPGPQGGGAMGASGGLGGPMGSGMGNPRDQGLQQPPQRADVADMERFQQGSNRIGTPTLAGGGASRGQMAVGGSRPIGPHSNNNNNNNNNNSTSQQNSNNQRFSEQSPMLWRNGGGGGGSGPRGNPFNSNPSLDLSEFPSLTNRDSAANINPMSGRTPYVVRLNQHFAFGMVKNPNSEASEFHIQNEDFPALPGSNHSNLGNQQSPSTTGPQQDTSGNPGSNSQQQISQQVNNAKNGLSNGHIMTGDKSVNGGPLKGDPAGLASHQGNPSGQSAVGSRKQIITTKDGRVSNIPPGMIRDQYGMVGLLTFIRVAESEPNLVTLALGSDLTTLGLNLNSQENLFTVFGGPWAEQALRPHEMEYSVPTEYLINSQIKDKLSPIKLHRYSEDTLFFLFYMYGGDIMQLVAASELYNRDWRFHRDERVWITRAGINPTEKTSTYERGTYYFFDPVNWRKVAKEFHLEYERLEERPPPLSFPSGL